MSPPFLVDVAESQRGEPLVRGRNRAGLWRLRARTATTANVLCRE
jgi:hypothetical protein